MRFFAAIANEAPEPRVLGDSFDPLSYRNLSVLAGVIYVKALQWNKTIHRCTPEYPATTLRLGLRHMVGQREYALEQWVSLHEMTQYHAPLELLVTTLEHLEQGLTEALYEE